jgi:chorismate mutase
VEEIVPAITKRVVLSGKAKEERDDGNYGSSATRDVDVLQALSRRIHFGERGVPGSGVPLRADDMQRRLGVQGMFVSESKFREAPHLFIPHILSDPPNTEALAGLITKPAVEAALLVRLGNKANIYGQELGPDGKFVANKEAVRIDTEEVVGLYRDWVIPLTKDVEVGVGRLSSGLS